MDGFAASRPRPSHLDACVDVSRRIGGDSSLALHGSGNTSVKVESAAAAGRSRSLLWIKASARDLATVDAGSFTAVDLARLRRLPARRGVDELAAAREVRRALVDAAAPAPSIETLTHAVLPHRYVLHAHPDAVLAVTSVPAGARAARRVFGRGYAVIPWAPPGLPLARAVRQAWHRRGRDLRGMVLLNHGILVFADDAEAAWQALLDCVARAEAALPARPSRAASRAAPAWSGAQIALLRRAVSRLAGPPMVTALDDSEVARRFAALPRAGVLGRRGPLSACHVARTRRSAAFVPRAADVEPALARYAAEQRRSFRRFADGRPLVMRDPAPRVVIAPGAGVFACGVDAAEALAVRDLWHHAMPAMLAAERLGGYRPLSARQLFALEYRPTEPHAARQPSFPPPGAPGTHRLTGERARAAGRP